MKNTPKRQIVNCANKYAAILHVIGNKAFRMNADSVVKWTWLNQGNLQSLADPVSRPERCQQKFTGNKGKCVVDKKYSVRD